MREIKFRVWDTARKNMCHFNPKIHNVEMIFGSKDEEFENCFKPMQFTGLKDKNGVEIYEGDIIKQGGAIHEIKYEEIYNCGCCYDDSGIGFNFKDYNNEDCEVIGNIYENPELLEGDK